LKIKTIWNPKNFLTSSLEPTLFNLYPASFDFNPRFNGAMDGADEDVGGN